MSYLIKTLCMQERLVARTSYWDLTRGEIRESYNGMGPGRLGGWLVPDTMYGLRVTEAGNIHDHMYAHAGDQQDKWVADIMLLVNTLTIIERKSRSRILRWLRRRRALLYFDAVADFGRWFLTYSEANKKSLKG